jgi:hypothetical protein
MSNSRRFSRRRFLQSGGALLAGSLLGGANAADSPAAPPSIQKILRRAGAASSGGTRVIVVGGGWSGLTMAKYLKRFNPAFDITLIDRQQYFLSFPLSNPWLADQLNLDFLSHSFYDAANNHGYRFLQADMLGLDRESRRVYTDQGYLEYDYLVMAPGVEYDYARIGIDDPAQQQQLFQHYPGGFVAGSELLTIKRKVESFNGGTFLLTVPNGDYRCSAAPYERACMIAAMFKRRIRASPSRRRDSRAPSKNSTATTSTTSPARKSAASISAADCSKPPSTSTRSTMRSSIRRCAPPA